MYIIDFILDTLKYSISGLIVFFSAWFVIRNYLSERFNLERMAIKRAGLNYTLPLRLQAYERTVLFLERVNPTSILIRLHSPGITAREMQGLVISEIQSEYQHNISQQIYLSDLAWATLKQVKEDTIVLINSAVNGLPEDASGVELSRVVLTHLANLETDNPYDIALLMVKRDLQLLF